MVPHPAVRQGPVTTTAPPPEFDEIMLLIGRLNYSWTNTESLLIHLIAGLAGTDKETAVIVFLTLNTTRARVDLIDRLAKKEGRVADERDRVLGLMRRLLRFSGLRNRYNHCIYSFDPDGGAVRTIQIHLHADAALPREQAGPTGPSAQSRFQFPITQGS
jgi:hypothetical protein